MKIIDDEEYEKNKSFTIELGEPVLLEIGQKHGESACIPCVCEWLLFKENIKNSGAVTGTIDECDRQSLKALPPESQASYTPIWYKQGIDYLRPPI